MVIVSVLSAMIVGLRVVITKTSNAIITAIQSDEDKNPNKTPVKVPGKDPNKTDDKKDTISEESFGKKDVYMGSGRIDIWKDTLQLVKRMPIFGICPGNSKLYAQKFDIAAYTLAKGKEVHNSYLDLLLNYGAVGFLIMMAFLVLCIKNVLTKVFKFGKKLDFSYYLVMFSVMVVAITSFFLTSLFISTTAVSFIVFITLGYLVIYNPDDYEQHTSEA